MRNISFHMVRPFYLGKNFNRLLWKTDETYVFPFGHIADTQVHKWLNDIHIDPQAMVALQPLAESILSSNLVRLKLGSRTIPHKDVFKRPFWRNSFRMTDTGSSTHNFLALQIYPSTSSTRGFNCSGRRDFSTPRSSRNLSRRISISTNQAPKSDKMSIVALSSHQISKAETSSQCGHIIYFWK
jgi:hypothetical protein